jgi:hypothetical protein
MYYKEFLRVRNAVLWYCGTMLVMALFITAISVLTPGSVKVDPPSTPIEHLPWALLFAIASFGGAIVATILCSALSKENDGHLEVAWTKPVSRATYASITMAVDAAGILICHIVTFALVLIPIVLLAHHTVLVGGPDTALQVLRFTIFPLAWYALLVAFSASLRGQAGIVQGLSWIVALGLIGGLAAPLPALLHGVLQAIDYLNPILYTTYSVGNGSDTNGINIGESFGVAVSVAALTAITAGGWFAAVTQWRRLQA